MNYKKYVGPEDEYDLIAAMTFNLLTCCGLRSHHKLWDIGCGSLRIGRVLIPYLDKGNYHGGEPNVELLKEGIKHEVGDSLLDIKSPKFNEFPVYGRNKSEQFDYILTQSIFSHCSIELITSWLENAYFHMKDPGVFFATFVRGDKNYIFNDLPDDTEWIYPGCVEYTFETMRDLATEVGFNFKILDFSHPRQEWVAFYKKDFDTTLINRISWNDFMMHSRENKKS